VNTIINIRLYRIRGVLWQVDWLCYLSRTLLSEVQLLRRIVFPADGTAGTKPPAKRKKEPATPKQQQNATSPSTVSDTQSGALSDGGHGSDGERKRKKARTTFTGRQIFELEKQFEVKKYLSSSERAEMAKLLNVTETQVRNEKQVVGINTNKFLKCRWLHWLIIECVFLEARTKLLHFVRVSFAL